MTFEEKIDAICRMLGIGEAETGEVLEGLPRPAAREIVSRMLAEIGMPEHLRGHAYTVKALELVISDRQYLHNMTKKLYPTVAQAFDSTASRVERAMHHAIEVAFDRCLPDVQEKYFGGAIHPGKGKPTVSELLARLSNLAAAELKQGGGRCGR